MAENAGKIASIVPSRVVFADAAGLKLKFSRQITDEELKKMEALLPQDQAMQLGLDRYISEWDGTGNILKPVLDENMFHFWWD